MITYSSFLLLLGLVFKDLNYIYVIKKQQQKKHNNMKIC